MKSAFTWIMVFVFIHAMLSLFSLIGSFGSFPIMGEPEANWGIVDIANTLGLLGFSGVGTVGVGFLTSVVAVRAGLNPFIGIGYGIVTGLFVNTWIRLFGLINQISSELGPYSIILTFVGFVTFTAFGYLLIITLKEMSAPSVLRG